MSMLRCLLLSCLLSGVLFCSVSCNSGKTEQDIARDSIANITVDRFDVLQYAYVISGDYSALQQMSLLYPTETRTLIEDVLQIGHVTDLSVNSELVQFYQDSLMMRLAHDAERAYSDMSDVEQDLRSAFQKLHQLMPDLPLPSFYAQIGSLQQSIIVNNSRIGISLEKYLGHDYPLYIRFYSASQRMMMDRPFIAADCLCFFLLSRYTLTHFDTRQQWERDAYIAKIQWIANRCLPKPVFASEYINGVERYMKDHRHTKLHTLLTEDNLSSFRP